MPPDYHTLRTRPVHPKIFSVDFRIVQASADLVLARRHEAKPSLYRFRPHQLTVMLENHLWRAARLQRDLLNILHVRHAVADECVPQRIVFQTNGCHPPSAVVSTPAGTTVPHRFQVTAKPRSKELK